LVRFLRRLQGRLRAEAGDVYVEYVVLAAVAVLVILGSILYFGTGIGEMFRRLIDTVLGI